MKMNKELELFKLITDVDEYDDTLVSEFGWRNEHFYVWVDYIDIYYFMKKLIEIFGYSLFDDERFDANMQTDGICFDLKEVLGGYGVDLERVFPKDVYTN